MKRATHWLLIAALIALAIGSAYAAGTSSSNPTVVFDAEQKSFQFENCASYDYETDGETKTYFDLFPNMKGMMPGDVVSQEITVRVDNIGTNRVKMYLKAENPNEDYAVLLTDGTATEYPVTLQAAFTNSSLSPQLLRRLLNFSANSGRELTYTEPIGEQIYLGAYSSAAAEHEITMTLNMPKEAGNELQGLTATVDWVFVAEVYPMGLDGVGGGGGDVGGIGGNPPPEPVEETDRIWNVTVERDYHTAYIIGRPDGLVHPEQPITRAEAATIFFRLLSEEARQHYWYTRNAYSDVAANDWHNNAISTLAKAGIVKGCPDGSFRPNDNISRAEFVTMVSRVVEAKEVTKHSFRDTRGHWAESAVDNAQSIGIVQGYSDGLFHPNEQVTRAEVMAICNRLLGRVSHANGLLEDMIVWPDNMDTEKWYYLDVQEATNSHQHRLDGEEFDDTGREYWVQIESVHSWKTYEQYVESENVYRSDR